MQEGTLYIFKWASSYRLACQWLSWWSREEQEKVPFLSFTFFSILTQWDRNNAMFWFNFLPRGLSPACTEAVHSLAPARIFIVGCTSPRYELFSPSFFFFLLEGLKIHPVLFPTLHHSSKLVILIPKAIPQKGKGRCGPLSLGSTGLDASSLFARNWARTPSLCPHMTTTRRNKILISASLKPLPCREEQDH